MTLLRWEVPVDALMSKINLPNEQGCMEWSAYRNEDGYGVIRVGKRTQLAHRVAYAYWNGPVPPRMKVLHHCDNPPCCHPDHLYVGTQAQNVADMIARGRHGRGRLKLTDEQVAEIRARYQPGLASALAREFGVSRPFLYRLVNGKRR